jgi:hypothetical protein
MEILPRFRPLDGYETQLPINMSTTWTITRNWQYIPGLCRLRQLNNDMKSQVFSFTSPGTIGLAITQTLKTQQITLPLIQLPQRRTMGLIN